MRKLIALQARGNMGKTTTITEFYKWLSSNYQTEIVKPNNKSLNNSDIALVVKVNGRLIGICSQGDPNSSLKIDLRIFIDIKCEIIICSCRTSGMTVDWVNSCKEDGYEVELIKLKTRSYTNLELLKLSVINYITKTE